MKTIELTGKLSAVKITPECGQLETKEISAVDQEHSYDMIAWLVQTGAEIKATISTPGPVGQRTSIETKGTVKSATIKPDGCQLKYDGFDFTPDQYKRLAEIVKGDLTTIFVIEPTQGEFEF